MDEFIPKILPLNIELETKDILKKVISANRALATLNGVAKIIPNQSILINSLVLQEAKDSSEIENIITTHDEIYQSSIDNSNISQSAKEIQNYREALLKGFDLVKNSDLLLTKYIIDIQMELEKNVAGIRKQSGTLLKNPLTNEVKYKPPQNYEDILKLLSNLENYINDDTLEDYDPLIKMAIIHYQFESIHPFYDGNGRTGRIMNILYLVYKGLLELPILYLSKYIIKNKFKYYTLLEDVQNSNNWKEWIFYMLDGIEETSKDTIKLIENIQFLMESTKLKIEANSPKLYSKDLLEILFSYPYTKIEFLVERLNLHRETASKYLKSLEKLGILKSVKMGRVKFFVNIELFELLKNR